MPPIAPIQVGPGGTPSHAIPTRTNLVSAVALHSMTRQCICSAEQGLMQRCSAFLHLRCSTRQFNLTFCLEDSLHLFVRIVSAVLQNEVSPSSDNTREDEAGRKEHYPGTHVGHSRHHGTARGRPRNI